MDSWIGSKNGSGARGETGIGTADTVASRHFASIPPHEPRLIAVTPSEDPTGGSFRNEDRFRDISRHGRHSLSESQASDAQSAVAWSVVDQRGSQDRKKKGKRDIRFEYVKSRRISISPWKRAGDRGLTAYVLASAICRLKMSGGLIETRPRTYSRACTGRGQGAVG